MSETDRNQPPSKEAVVDGLGTIVGVQSQVLGALGDKPGKVAGGVIGAAYEAGVGVAKAATSPAEEARAELAEAFGRIAGGFIGGGLGTLTGLVTGANPVVTAALSYEISQRGADIGGRIAGNEARNPQNPLDFDEVNQTFTSRYGDRSDQAGNQQGNGGNGGSLSGFQHDLGRDGYGNDDTSQNPSRGGNSPTSDAVNYGGGEYGGGGGNDEAEDPGQDAVDSAHADNDEAEDPGQDAVDDAHNDDPGGEGGDGGGGGGGKPIVLDLDGDGVELVALEDSTAFFDINGDGYRERMAWASADDGFLAYDKDGDGVISAHDELSFVSYVEGAETDLEGLAHFDTNGNGKLDSGDADWSKFRVWQDLDRDGVSDAGELRTLDEAGITEISLTSDGVQNRRFPGTRCSGRARYTDGDGSQSFFDVALQHSDVGHQGGRGWQHHGGQRRECAAAHCRADGRRRSGAWTPRCWALRAS